MSRPSSIRSQPTGYQTSPSATNYQSNPSAANDETNPYLPNYQTNPYAMSQQSSSSPRSPESITSTRTFHSHPVSIQSGARPRIFFQTNSTESQPPSSISSGGYNLSDELTNEAMEESRTLLVTALHELETLSGPTIYGLLLDFCQRHFRNIQEDMEAAANKPEAWLSLFIREDGLFSNTARPACKEPYVGPRVEAKGRGAACRFVARAGARFHLFSYPMQEELNALGIHIIPGKADAYMAEYEAARAALVHWLASDRTPGPSRSGPRGLTELQKWRADVEGRALLATAMYALKEIRERSFAERVELDNHYKKLEQAGERVFGPSFRNDKAAVEKYDGNRSRWAINEDGFFSDSAIPRPESKESQRPYLGNQQPREAVRSFVSRVEARLIMLGKKVEPFHEVGKTVWDNPYYDFQVENALDSLKRSAYETSKHRRR